MNEGSVAAVVVGAACLVFLVQAAGQRPLSALAFLAVAAVVLLLIRRVATVRDDVAQLAASEARFRALVQHSSDVILIVDPDSTIRYASPSASRVFGRPYRDLVGRRMHALVHADDVVEATRFLDALRDTPASSCVGEWRLLRDDGTWLWTENTGTNLLAEPTVQGVVINARDISERRSLESRLTHQVFHDELTHLANRSLFLNRVAHAVARAPRGQHPAAVLFLDLDDFKKVNDSLGHAVGDELLIATASRLATCIRPGDTIARLGGDEFAVLLEDVNTQDDIVVVADRITTAMRSPFRVSGREVFVGVSAGIATVGLGDSPDDVLRNADLAMYFAKAKDKGRFAIYEQRMHRSVLDRLELEADLRSAVDRSLFHVEYQPIVHLESGTVCGAEALLRWEHPQRGMVPPSLFIALAEETGLIVPIGRVVLQQACERANEWRRHRRASGDHPFSMSVNLSGRHFEEASLIDDVEHALQSSGLEPWCLTLEITESVLMQRSEGTLEKLRRLKKIGLSLAIDDFGTGYSSLGYLQKFPIDVLKIDRTFVEAVGNENVDPVLARAIIALGRTLRIETVAEGIERSRQRDGLRALGCTMGQGYLFAHPMSAGAFAARYFNSAAPAPRAVLGSA